MATRRPGRVPGPQRAIAACRSHIVMGVVLGFGVVGVAIFTGYVVGRIDLLGPHARFVLARLTFFVLSPFLLFVVLADADLGMLFSALLPVSALAAVAMFVVYSLIAWLVWKRRLADVVIGSLGAGYVNGNNIGLPISLYLLGDAAYSAPVILVQLLVFTPVVLALLDAATSGHKSFVRILRRTARNPMLIGAAAGTLVSALGIELPPIVHDPAALIADAAVPILLISYGLSLHGQRVLTNRAYRRDILVATGLKLLLMPVAAWLIGRFLFALDNDTLLIVVVLAALPSAQNVFNYAQRYETAEVLARDTVFLTTIGCIPVLFAVSLLLGA